MRLIGMQRGQQMGGRERPGGGDGFGSEGVSTRLYQPSPTHAPRFFPGDTRWGSGIIKLVECLLRAMHCPG